MDASDLSLSGGCVLCVGDIMLDRFVYGRVERISPEGPIPVLHITRETTMPGGGEWYTIQFTTTLGERLAALLVPDTIAAMPTWGHAATVAVSWLPTALTVCLVLRVLRGPSRVPGEIPDILAQAFRHLPVD